MFPYPQCEKCMDSKGCPNDLCKKTLDATTSIKEALTQAGKIHATTVIVSVEHLKLLFASFINLETILSDTEKENKKLSYKCGRILEWTHTFGKDLCPLGSDTYGEGVRASKKQVTNFLTWERS